MMRKNKKALSSQALVILVILIVLVVMIFSSGVAKEANPNEKDSAAYKISEFLKSLGLFAEQGSQNQLYAKGNTDKLLQLPKDVNPDPLYGYPFENFVTCVTSDFGPRDHPPENFHYGIDLRCKDFSPAGNPNRPIKSISGGKVVLIRRDGAAEIPNGYDAGPVSGELGSQVHVYDKDNGYLIIYGHLSQITATPDSIINPGDEIGNCGTTGASTAEHLHLQIHAIEERGEEDIDKEERVLNGKVYDFTKNIPTRGGPVNPAKLILPRLQCCRDLAGGQDACNPRIVDKEEMLIRGQ